ncbi:hypothetical protein, conserved [Plasmodium ovale]|uniref:PIR protein n=1 Tax=Plasmodium ovale TaxID=36330 RepID=A0A1C3KIG5_PLAOA|nr:hypothetical protein, conserved [Plasmodium ovale]
MTDDEDITSLKEFPEKCEDNSDRQKCFTETQDDSEYCSTVSGKLSVFKQKLIKILKGDEADLNDFFPERNIEDTDKLCICLKQWFYNEVIKDAKEQTNGYKLLKTCNSNINDKINGVTSNLCIFRNLNFREMVKIKTIFDFYLFYYKKLQDFTVNKKPNKYPKYFRKGFYEHCNSIIHCLNSTSNGEYCKEFKEYHTKYNALKVFLESLLSYKEKVDGSDCTNGCVLSESLLKGKYFLELRGEIEKIKSRYRSNNSLTTGITIIPSELWSRIRKLKNKETDTNVYDETESNSLFTSENQENSFKNKGYVISYNSAIYS